MATQKATKRAKPAVQPVVEAPAEQLVAQQVDPLGIQPDVQQHNVLTASSNTCPVSKPVVQFQKEGKIRMETWAIPVRKIYVLFEIPVYRCEKYRWPQAKPCPQPRYYSQRDHARPTPGGLRPRVEVANQMPLCHARIWWTGFPPGHENCLILQNHSAAILPLSVKISESSKCSVIITII